MNQTEFNQWTSIHAKAFGKGITETLADIDTAKMWFSVLEGVALEDAKEATRRMLADVSQQPHGWHKHPATVRGIAYAVKCEREASSKEARRRYVGGNRVFSCPHCLDNGFVLDVIAPKWVRLYRQGGVKVERSTRTVRNREGKSESFAVIVLDPRPAKFALACCCRAGRDWNVVRRYANRPPCQATVYDPERHLRTNAYGDALIAELDAWNADHKPANYVSDFDAYNAGEEGF